MRSKGRFRLDGRAIFVLSALLGAGSLFVTTLTSDAPETFAESPAAEPPAEPSVAPAAVVPPIEKKSTGCLTGEASIADLQDLRADLAKRETELKRRETELAAQERAMAEELKKLETVRDEIKQAQTFGDSKNEEKIAKLVETFESMSPKAASAIVSSVDENLAVAAMSRVSSLKLGKILAAMETEKSAPLAERIAGVVRARKPASKDAAETTNRVKGGEENGNRKQLNTDTVSSRQPEPAIGREPTAEKR